jgi:transcription elongation factor Elf1
MVDFVDLQYAQMLSGRLENFRIRHTSPYKINFRCPICGDSQKSRSKSRGWLLEKENKFFYYCHNCGESSNFANFLKGLDNLLYKDWVAEKFIKKDDKPVKPTIDENKFAQPKFIKSPLKKIKKISQLHQDHPVKLYIKNREIPPNAHWRLYYTPKFMSWINEIIPGKFQIRDKDEPRLVMPFLDRNGKIFGVSARGFNPNTVRYMTIMFDDRPKIFGLDTVDFNKQYYVCEGAIDSFFVTNAVAMAGADGTTKGLENFENAVFVFDAEPRNREIVKRMEKVIENGYRICIWPDDVPGKDINEMVLAGTENVNAIIQDNIFKGLQAKLKLQQWRKV